MSLGDVVTLLECGSGSGSATDSNGFVVGDEVVVVGGCSMISLLDAGPLTRLMVTELSTLIALSTLRRDRRARRFRGIHMALDPMI